jgi:hypothetical protein
MGEGGRHDVWRVRGYAEVLEVIESVAFVVAKRWPGRRRATEAHRVLEQLLQLIVAELWDPGQLSLQTGLRVLEADQVEEQPAKTAPPVLEGLAPT